jgi:hypothetical protein
MVDFGISGISQSVVSLSTYLSIYGYTALVCFDRFFSSLIYARSVRLLRREIRPSQDRYLHTEQHKQNKRTQTSMPRVGFEPTTLVFERAKTVHADDSFVWQRAPYILFRANLFTL